MMKKMLKNINEELSQLPLQINSRYSKTMKLTVKQIKNVNSMVAFDKPSLFCFWTLVRMVSLSHVTVEKFFNSVLNSAA